jgi:hypothetical protein
VDYHLPKLQFDRTRYISIEQAFERLGCCMFPRDWSGLELLSWPCETPEELSLKKESLEREVTSRRQDAKVLANLTLQAEDQDERKVLEKRAEEARTLCGAANSLLWDFNTSYNLRFSDALCFARRETVSKELCRAIQEREIDTFLDRGSAHSSIRDWAVHHDFKISFNHSHIYTPATFGRRKKHIAFFLTASFDQWLTPYSERIRAYRAVAAEDDLVTWFRGRAKELLDRDQRISRSFFLEQCKESFERADEIKGIDKKFEAVWELFAPDDWRKGGKPPNR